MNSTEFGCNMKQPQTNNKYEHQTNGVMTDIQDESKLNGTKYKRNGLSTKVSIAEPHPSQSIPVKGQTCPVLFICNVWAYIGRPVVLLLLLYTFICSLDIMSSAFRLIGGKVAGEALSKSAVLTNPVGGLMVGVLITVAVQSSSTSTSIFITMVASEMLRIEDVIYMMMGANIGTSITNTLVALTQMNDREEFRLAFAGATVHDMFNWLTVLILVPLEIASGYLNHLSTAIIDSMNLKQYSAANQDLLKTITKPLTDLVVQVDSKIVNDPEKLASAETILKYCCKKDGNSTSNSSKVHCLQKCTFMFVDKANVWSDQVIGTILLLLSLAVLIGCLIGLVKLLKLILANRLSEPVKSVINSKRLGWFTGYVAIFVGTLMTILLQSSSVFTSTLTPLVGTGFLSIELMYPLTLGSNVGTTVTGILAALASDNRTISKAMQAAMIHLFFNITGIMIWYPIPILRRVPLSLAKLLGKTTSTYRWMALIYLILMFLLLPGIVFGLSFVHPSLPFVFVALLILPMVCVAIIRLVQRKWPHALPPVLRNWDFLPLPLRSLAPYDRVLTGLLCCMRFKSKVESEPVVEECVEEGNTNEAFESKDRSETKL